MRIRKNLRISGIVQGVGFRPFIYRLALKHCLGGYVRNTPSCVEIAVEGLPEGLEAFCRDLTDSAPILACLQEVVSEDAPPLGEENFSILASHGSGEAAAVIPADIGLCPDCAAEILSQQNRRYFYPFTNCTNCGPRFTIIKNLPYDRAHTTMAGFAMCDACRQEYENPLDRRFHAEPTACPACGPVVWLEIGGRRRSRECLTQAAEMLWNGKIIAIKGLGGFHLACDARQEPVVQLLRQRKGRRDKPFAVMVRDLAAAEAICELNRFEKSWLRSPASPIVLARQRANPGIAASLAPGNRYLGLMLPYTPLHLLLFQHSPDALVMTSGNRSEEPLAFTNDEARRTLGELADAFLFHNRDIHVPCDDSVVRPLHDGSTIILRRARGYVPDTIQLPLPCHEDLLGVGAQDKTTFGLAWRRTALLSQHLGNLDLVETIDYYRGAIDHFQTLSRRRPTVAAHDLHPGYVSTSYAKGLDNVRLIAVQHHHAHIAACLAENGRLERCLGLAFDGAGYGPDGTIWGGEILAADLADYTRVGHFAPVVLPGGDAAAQNPNFMALSYLFAVYGEAALSQAARLDLRFSPLQERLLLRQIATGWQSPVTTSAGRLFDAVAAALDICRERTYEGQPALELEMVAEGQDWGYYPLKIGHHHNQLVIDTIALFRQVVEDRQRGVAPAVISAHFHESLARGCVAACLTLRERLRLNLVALSGGVWQNARLFLRTKELLTKAGFEVIFHRQTPANDGGIALGQIAVAAAVLDREQ